MSRRFFFLPAVFLVFVCSPAFGQEALGFAVSVDTTSVVEGNTVEFSVRLNANPLSRDGATVDWTIGGTVTADDHDAPLRGTLTFTRDNPNTPQTVPVRLLADIVHESAETLTLTLSNPSPGTIPLATPSATATVTDAPLPRRTVVAVANAPDTEEGATASFPLTFSGHPPTGDVTVTFHLGAPAGRGPGMDGVTASEFTYAATDPGAPATGQVLRRVRTYTAAQVAAAMAGTVPLSIGIAIADDGDFTEGEETVRLTLVPGPQYTHAAGSPARVSRTAAAAATDNLRIAAAGRHAQVAIPDRRLRPVIVRESDATVAEGGVEVDGEAVEVNVRGVSQVNSADVEERVLSVDFSVRRDWLGSAWRLSMNGAREMRGVEREWGRNVSLELAVERGALAPFARLAVGGGGDLWTAGMRYAGGGRLNLHLALEAATRRGAGGDYRNFFSGEWRF